MQVFKTASERRSPERREYVHSNHVIFDRRVLIRLVGESSTKIGQDVNSSSDRGSIKFLLNSGTASFIECFRFPASHERRSNLNLSNEATILDVFENGIEKGNNFPALFPDEAIDWSLFEDESLLKFLSGPFTEVQMQSDDLFAPFFMDPNFVSAPPPPIPASFPTEREPPSLQSAAIVQGILERATSLHVCPQKLADISQNLEYLFTPSRIQKLVNLYFESWHRNCTVLHQGSFLIETAPLPLLTSVVLMGAMYSQVDVEVSTAKSVLDVAELYAFSTEDLRDESEILQMMRTSITSPDQVVSSGLAFENLFAAYLMVCAQFWAGSMIARKRAVETRFATIVKVCFVWIESPSGSLTSKFR